MNITLIGYRGTGKSTAARLVAERLGWTWVDADAFLEEQAGQAIRDIFAREGEAGFRDREAAVIQELTRRDRHVIAAGGGAVLRTENRDAFRKTCMTVWLVASAEVIERRLAADATTAERRPALTREGGAAEIRRLLAEREPLYRAAADVIVETDSQTPAEVAERITQTFVLWRPSKSME